MKNKTLLEIDHDFSGGLNTDQPRALVKQKELIRADNVDILSRGGFKKRKGTVNLGNENYEEEVHQLINFPRNDGSEELLAIIGNQFCRLDRGSGEKTELQTVNNFRVPYFFLHDRLYFIDTGVEFYEYDGLSVKTVIPHDDERNNLEPIKRCRYAEYHSHSNRIFFAGDTDNNSAIYWSEYLMPNYVKETSQFYPTRAAGAVKGLISIMDAIFVGFAHSNWVWRGIDPASDAIWERLPTAHGPINNDCLEMGTQGLYMVSPGGIMKLSPNIVGINMDTAVGGYIKSLSKNKVDNLLREIKDLNNVKCVYHPEHHKFYLAIDDKILVLDTATESYSLYDLDINDFVLMNDGTLYMAAQSTVVSFSDIYEDMSGDETAEIIKMMVATPEYTLKNSLANKLVSRLFVTYKNFGPETRIDLKLLVDGEMKQEFELWGDDSQKNFLSMRRKLRWRGKTFQLKFISDQYGPAEVYAVGFEYKQAETGGKTI